MRSAGVTPELLLRDFKALFDSQTRSLRDLALRSQVGPETIRGWKDKGHFPRSTDAFMRVVRTCLGSLKQDAHAPALDAEGWLHRYQQARTVWENQESDRRPAATPTHESEPRPASVEVHGGDFVNGVKNALHIGDVHHNPVPREPWR